VRARLPRLAGRAWAGNMRMNGPMISRFDLADARRPFATQYFCMHGENCASLFWQAIILILMVIALIVLVD
jgi:hypothetical protein